MPLTERHRRELVAILALAVGAFVALSLLPTTITGPLGRLIGNLFGTYLGVGAMIIPFLSVVIGAVGFGRFPSLDLKRITILCAGLLVLVPYWIAWLTGVNETGDLPADYADWMLRHKLVGVLPAFLVIGFTSVIGTAGAGLIGLVSLSALTLYTVGWHPFYRFAPSEKKLFTPKVVPVVETIPIQEDVEPDPPPPDAGRRRRFLGRDKPKKALKPEATAKGEEQAFIVGTAISPFSIELLAKPGRSNADEDEAELNRLGHVLVDTLRTFKVDAELGTHRSTGPVVTQFEVAPAPGVKVGRIAALADDLALKMEAKSIRIVAPIPGKSFVGVEVPNPTPRMVALREMLAPPRWDRQQTGLPIALGEDLEGRPVAADLTKMPHLLIAGATGSGKSVCINTIVTSLIFRYTERELRMLMIDPKMVELSAYNALPHLIYPVVTNNKDAAMALKWAMYEMERRYELFSVNNARNLHEFNRKVKSEKGVVMPKYDTDPEVHPQERTLPSGKTVIPYDGTTLPYVVVIVDELADLMMTVQADVEKPLAMLAQKARATGIHLILATQRPSVNVITGLIKANFPSRIAFRVASKVDSRTILDQNGAEALLGNGDMLFLPPGKSEPIRVQGAFIGTEETERVTEYYQTERDRLAEGGWVETEDILALVKAREMVEDPTGDGRAGGEPVDRDALFREAAELCITNQLGSTSLLQRKMRIGYGRAARIIDQLHDAGILSAPDGSKPREVLIASHQLDEYCS